MNWGIFLFIIAILTVVMIHESGHFLMAKLFGFKATKFFIGFGPPLWSFKRGETEYGIAAIPAGGFVKIVGMNPYEEVAPEDEPRSYPNKPIWQRAIVIVAGSATHFIVAFVLLVFTAMVIGFPTGQPTNEVGSISTRTEGEVTPAFDAGLEPGDKVVAVDGTATDSWSETRVAIRSHPGEHVTFTVERDGEELDIPVSLGQAIFEGDNMLEFAPAGEDIRAPNAGEELVGFLGVSPAPEYKTENFVGAVSEGAYWTWDTTKRSVAGMGEIFTMVFGGELWDAVTGSGERNIDEGPLGLVGAGRIAGQTVQRGQYLEFIGLIVGFTIFVGLMNLLPLPPLDGGHLAVLAWEKITGRKVDIRKLIPIAAAVISFFVILFIAVLYLDLARPIRVPF